MVNAWIPLVEALSVLSLTCFLVYKYADTKRTNWFSLVITAVSWFLAFSMIFFIPLDIYSTSTNGEANNFLIFWWYFYYWTSFVLSVLVLPVLGAYLEAADFTMRGRLISSVKQNLPYYALYVILFIALVCFLYLSSVGKDIVE